MTTKKLQLTFLYVGLEVFKSAVILMILFQNEMNIYYDNKDDWFYDIIG